MGVQVHGSWIGNEESDYYGGDDNAESQPESDTRQGGARFTLTPDKQNEFSLGVTSSTKEYTHTPGRSIDLVDSRGNPTTTSTYRYDKDVFTLGHKGTYDSWMVDSYLQHDISERVSDDEKKEEMSTFNTQATRFWGNHVLTLGGQYRQEELVDETNGLLTSNVPGAVRSVDRWIGALFAEVEWGVTDDLNVTTGVRYDDDELFGGHFSPRLYANYRLDPQWTLKGGISTGYKQPGLADATEGFGRGTGGAGSPAPHPRALIIGNPALDPETSTNYELGMVFNNATGDVSASATLFHTRFDDKIAEDRLCDPGGDSDDPATWQCDYAGDDYLFLSTRKNIDEAEMQGVELTLDVALTPAVGLSSSYTFTDSEQKSGEFAGEPLNKIPEHMVNLQLDWQASNDLNLWVQGNYRSETSDFLGRRSMEEGMPGYGFVDTGLVYALNDSARIKAGIYNLADKEVTNDDYGVVLDGRRLNLGLTVDF